MKANINGVLNKTTIGRGVALESSTSRLLKPLQSPSSSELANFQAKSLEFNLLQALRLAYNDYKTVITNDVLIDGGVAFSSDTTRIVFAGDDEGAGAPSRTINVGGINLNVDFYTFDITDTTSEYIIPIAASNWVEATRSINDVLSTQNLYSLTYDEASGNLTLTNIHDISSIRYIAINAHPVVRITVDTTDDAVEKPYFQFSDAIMDAELIGNPTAPTMPLEDDSNAIATTKFVHAVAAGGVIYKGTFDASVGNYNALSSSRIGYLYYVDKAGVINGVDWKIGDYLLVNADGATNVTKIDNTESTDIVRLNATQTLTNKTLTSPKLTGVPTVPTAAAGTNTTQAASTEFVTSAISNIKITVDSKPTLGSNNAVASGGVYDALALKQDKLIAGTNISIVNNVISSTHQTYKGSWSSTVNYKVGDIVSSSLQSTTPAKAVNSPQLFIAIQDNTNQLPSYESTYWKNFDTEKVNINTTTANADYNLLSSPQDSGVDTDVFAVDGKSPTVNLSTGLMKVPGGIDNYYNKKEVDDKIAAKDSLPAQDSTTEGDFLQSTSSGAIWSPIAIIRTWTD